MAVDAVEQVLSFFDEILAPHSLSNIQQLVIRGCWQGQTYSQIAEAAGYDDDYIRDVGFQLWRQLSKTLGQKVSKSNFQVVLRRYQQAQAQPKPEPVSAIPVAVQRSTAWMAEKKDLVRNLSRSQIEDHSQLISLLGLNNQPICKTLGG
jgi:uncharacterized protein YerC